MKTILVIYTHEKLNKKESQTLKKYAFNTTEKLAVGDMFESEDYVTPMQVVKVMDKTYRYYNTYTGELSNKKIASTKQFEIRLLQEASKTTGNVVLFERIQKRTSKS